MTVYDGKKLAHEKLLDIATYCIHSALKAPQITGRVQLEFEIVTDDDLNPFIEAFGLLMPIAGFHAISMLSYTAAVGAGAGTPWGPAGLIAARIPSLDRLGPWIFAAWVLGVLAVSLAHVAGWRRVQRLRRRGTREVSPRWQAIVADLCQRMGIARAVRLVESACVQVPTVIGWLSPVVLMPAGALTGRER